MESHAETTEIRAPARKLKNHRMEYAVRRLIPEMERLGSGQQNKIVRRLAQAPARFVEAEADLLIRKRHARRKARLQQKASRQRNHQ